MNDQDCKEGFIAWKQWTVRFNAITRTLNDIEYEYDVREVHVVRVGLRTAKIVVKVYLLEPD